MTRRRLTLVLFAIALAGLPLTGCWSRLETNELAEVLAYGVDWHGGTYQVVASILDPRALGTPGNAVAQPNQPAHILMTGTGATPGQALADLDNASSRRVLWGSAEVLVIGQSLAEHGISTLLSALTRDPAFRMTPRVLIAHGDARAVVAVDKSGLEPSISRDLYLTVENQHRAESYAWSPHVFDMERWDAEADRAILVPGVQGSQPKLPEGQAYAIADSAVLVDNRLVAWLPRDQARQVLWMEGLFVHGRFQVDCPNEPGMRGMVFVTGGQRRIRPVAQAGRLTSIDVTLTGRGQVTQGCAGAPVSTMAQASMKMVSSLADETVRWAQTRELDIFGFGEVAYRFMPRLWLSRYQQNWPPTFARLPVRVSVHILVTQPGMAE